MQAPIAADCGEPMMSHGHQFTPLGAPDFDEGTACDWSMRSEASSDPPSRFFSVPTVSSATSAAHDSSGVPEDKDCDYGAGRAA